MASSFGEGTALNKVTSCPPLVHDPDVDRGFAILIGRSTPSEEPDRRMKRFILGCLALIWAAPVTAADLFIDVRTNWTPRVDFSFVRVEVMDRSDERNQWRSLHVTGGDFLRGQRVAEFSDVGTRQTFFVQIELLDHRLRTIDGSIVLLDMPGGDFAMTALIARP